MFFLNELSSKGKWIYFATVIIAVAVLVWLSFLWPNDRYIAKFFIFAGIWFSGFHFARKFKQEEK